MSQLTTPSHSAPSDHSHQLHHYKKKKKKKKRTQTITRVNLIDRLETHKLNKWSFWHIGWLDSWIFNQFDITLDAVMIKFKS